MTLFFPVKTDNLNNRWSVINVAVALIIVTSSFANYAMARTLEEVKASGQLSVFVYDDYPPYSFKEGGKLKGIDVELGRLMAEALGVNVSYLVRPADENVDDDLRINVWNCLLYTSPSPRDS